MYPTLRPVTIFKNAGVSFYEQCSKIENGLKFQIRGLKSKDFLKAVILSGLAQF